ncbi:DUF7573 domain-containing protein [Halostagnicola bangensis]
MTEDATLSAFQDSEDDAGASEGQADSSEDRSDSGNSEAVSEPDANAAERTDANTDIDPATSTYVWGTYTCDSCTETVARAWREGDGLVCPTCKDW